MAVNKFFQSGMNMSNKNEQDLIERMVVESIQIKGFDLYYLPKQTENLNDIMGEDPSSYFDHFHVIEMYLENVNGYGDGMMLSKFGLELRDTATFTVSRRRWEECTREDTTLQLPNRPVEGDILYFPLTKSFFEIKKVEHDNPFYQLGKLYVYKLDCELYQYSHEVFFTGDAEIDSINSRSTDELKNLALDEYGYGLLAENGDYILKDDYDLKSIEPLSDNEELYSNALDGLLNTSTTNPFAMIKKTNGNDQ